MNREQMGILHQDICDKHVAYAKYTPEFYISETY